MIYRIILILLASTSIAQVIFPIKKGNKWGYINVKGNLVVAPKYDRTFIGTENKYLAYKDGKYIFLNSKGKLLFGKRFEHATPFSEGKSVVKDSLGFFAIDNMGRDICSFRYLELTTFVNGISAFKAKDATWGYLGSNGKSIIKMQEGAGDVFCYGRALYRDAKGAYGYIDTSGKIIIKAQFQLASQFNKSGYAVIKISDMCGYIDRSGNIIISPQYESAYNFSNGIACVMKNGKYGFVDSIGNFLIPPRFEKSGFFLNGLSSIPVGNQWVIINRKGEYVKGPSDTAYSIREVNNNQIVIIQKSVDGKWGAVSPTGDILVEHKWFGVAVLPDNYFMISNDLYKVGVVNDRNQVLLEPNYDDLQYIGNGIVQLVFGGNIFQLDRENTYVKYYDLKKRKFIDNKLFTKETQ